MASDYAGIVMYDGECGLCNRSIKFLLRIDKRRVLQFTPLQGETAPAILARHADVEPSLDTVVYVRNVGQPDEQAFTHSTAAWRIWYDVGGRWKPPALLLRLIPRPVRDWGYEQVARHRHLLPGSDACALPTEASAGNRFLP